MINCKSNAELEKMRRSGQILHQVHEAVRAAVKPGATTMDLERVAEDKIREMGAKPAFKGYYDYPCVLCTSINNEIIHGIPSERRVLKEGDIVSIDCGVVLDGYYSDAAVTIPVGATLAPELKKLLDVTETSLQKAIQEVRLGKTLGDIGAAVQEYVEGNGFSVVRDFVGHGIGTRMHEDPQVPNFGVRGHGTRLREGMVLAIEPMVCAGSQYLIFDQDGWTIRTRDGSLAAHFEHTIAITQHGARILT